MGTHLIPREIDGDARILLIFTPKGFLGILLGFIPGIFETDDTLLQYIVNEEE